MKFLDFFGIGQMPWMMRIYMLLFIALLTTLAMSSGGQGENERKLFFIMEESFKLVLGALLGALSVAAQAQKASK